MSPGGGLRFLQLQELLENPLELESLERVVCSPISFAYGKQMPKPAQVYGHGEAGDARSLSAT